ncbi:ABC transporter permease [Streptomyces sp. NBC_01190]|uniref:ABC transporter permease n=1 Tax=Streptomyces sp. NBC_01190 TaxID=2903767 RepID=UPI00386B2BEB|nr:ABC transporter permease [Streptomyces sp. NBC_01190]
MAVQPPLIEPATLTAPPARRRRGGRARLTAVRFARNRLALFGLCVIVLLFVLAYGSPLFYKWGYTELDFTAFQKPPSASHWFGTDQTGSDLFALTMRGMQKSLVIGILTGLICTVVAAAIGASAGYFGGWTDRSLMWVVDLLLVMPSFLIIAVLSPLFQGTTWLVFVVLLAAFSWMITGRVVRSMTLTLKDREFVKAAKYMGVPAPVIIFRHILPSMASMLIIDGTIQVGAAIIGETSLSYFGFGVQPPDVSLGTVIATGTPAAPSFPWLFYFPAGCLVLVCLSIAFIGDGLRDALDPTSSRAKARAPRKSKNPSQEGRTS